MIAPKRTLVIVAFTTLMGCSPSPSLPATMPQASTHPLRLYSTSAVLPLVTDLTATYGDLNVTFETRTANFRAALNSLLLEGNDSPYLITTHLPPPESVAVRLWAAPLAQDGIAVIVNPANPLRNLTLDQLRAVYQGRHPAWRALGGGDDPLVVFSQEDGSDTRAEFERLVMGQRRVTLGARLVTSSAAMLEAVAATPGGIGYVSLAALDTRVRALTLDGIAPTQANVAQQLYPLRSTVFAVGLAEPAGAYRAFFGWVQSPAGQAVVAQHYAALAAGTP
ncbi:MAG: substrate-binding domain-containing protein [Armatimonadetes bacterium]|nr:substrate-binding domain-containing protein [Anaerolineae bacterium]